MEKRTALVSTASVAVALALGAWLYLRADASSQGPKAGGPPPVPVKVARAELRDVPVAIEVAGRAEAYETVTLKARVDGQVAAVPFVEGQHVRRGDLLVQLDAADFQARMRQAEANQARDRAQLAKARADVERYVALRARGFVSEEKVAEMRTAAAAAEATAAADQAAADLARLQLDYATVRAPFDGIAGARLVYPGSAVKANDTALAVVNRVQPLHVGFAVPEKYLARLRAARGTGERPAAAVSLPGDPSPPLAAEVRFLDNAVDPATGTVQLKALLANADEKLLPGQFVTVRLVLETVRQAVTVPAEAVQQGQDGSFLFVVEDGAAQVRKIGPASAHDGHAIIASGLAAGETVVTDGQLRLTPGAKVRPGGEGKPAPAP